MWFPFEFGARGWWFLRTPRGLREDTQIDAAGEPQKRHAKLIRRGVGEGFPFLLGNAQVHSGHGGGNLARYVVFRYRTIDVLGGMSGT